MTIPFTCSCGKSFRAKDEFAGKRTKCPACGQVLVIPQPAPEAAPPEQPAALLHVRCDCGKEFQVQPEFAGRSAKCPACGHALVIPGGPAAAVPPPAGPPAQPEAEAVGPTDPWPGMETPAEENDAPPLPKKRLARPRSRGRWVVVGVIVVLLLGAGAGAGWLWKQYQDAAKPIDRSARAGPKDPARAPATAPDEEAVKVDLGEDLNLVPKNAAAFAAVRVADLVASPLAQQLRKQPLARLLPDPDQEMERRVGLTPADIERVTVVAPGLNFGAYWAVVFTRKPYDQAKILQLLAPTEERQHQGKTYHYSEGRQTAVYFLKDHLVVAGPEEGVQGFLSPQAPPSPGMLAPLRLAATGRNQVTAAVRLPAIFLSSLPIPPDLQPFRPLLINNGVTLTLDSGEALELNAKLDFPDEATAAKAEEAAQALVKWGRERLAAYKQTVGQGPDGPAMQPALKLLESWTRDVPVRRQGKVVEVQWQADAADVLSAPAALLPVIGKLRSTRPDASPDK